MYNLLHVKLDDDFTIIWTSDCYVRPPNSVIFVRFVFSAKRMRHIRRGLKCNDIELYLSYVSSEQ